MIKIEFIANGAVEAPLVILYGLDPRATQLLSENLELLADGDRDAVFVNTLPGFSGDDLVFEQSDRDIGIVREKNHPFVCRLTPETWSTVKERLSAFCTEDAKIGPFAWLDESGEISLLFSTGRHW